MLGSLPNPRPNLARRLAPVAVSQSPMVQGLHLEHPFILGYWVAAPLFFFHFRLSGLCGSAARGGGPDRPLVEPAHPDERDSGKDSVQNAPLYFCCI